MYGNSTTSSTSHYPDLYVDLADLSNLPSEHMSIDSTEYLVYNVPGDGDCFFHSLSLTLHDHTCRTQYYRDRICGHIVDNWMLLEAMVKIYHHPSITQHEYMRNMQYGREWATGCEIKIASLLLSHQIDVYFKPSNKQNTIQLTPFNMSNSSNNFAIEVLLYGQHFHVLRRFGNQGQIQQPQTIPTIGKCKQPSTKVGQTQPSPIIPTDHNYAEPSHHANTQPPVYIPTDHNYAEPSHHANTQPPVYIPTYHSYAQPSDTPHWDNIQHPVSDPTDHMQQLSTPTRNNNHDDAQEAISGHDTTPETQSNVSYLKQIPIRKREHNGTGIRKYQFKKAKSPNHHSTDSRACTYQDKLFGNERFETSISSKEQAPNGEASDSNPRSRTDNQSGDVEIPISTKESNMQYECRKLGVNYEMPPTNESIMAKKPEDV